MTRVALIGCGKAKYEPGDDEWERETLPSREQIARYYSGRQGGAPHLRNWRCETIPLRDLYSSSYFGLKDDYATLYCDESRILSAKYGLVSADREVSDDYEKSLKKMDADAVEAWVSGVIPELEALARLDPNATVVVLAGSDYVDPLRDALARLPFDTEYPLEGFDGFGYQMQFLSNRVEAAENGVNSDENTDEGDGEEAMATDGGQTQANLSEFRSEG